MSLKIGFIGCGMVAEKFHVSGYREGKEVALSSLEKGASSASFGDPVAEVGA